MRADVKLEGSGIGDGGEASRVEAFEGEALECVDPEDSALEEMDDLSVEGWAAEAGQFLRVGTGDNRGGVVKQEGEAQVGPSVEFADAVKSEQRDLPLSIMIERSGAELRGEALCGLTDRDSISGPPATSSSAQLRDHAVVALH